MRNAAFFQLVLFLIFMKKMTTVHRKSELNIFLKYEQIPSNPSNLYLVDGLEKSAHTLNSLYIAKSLTLIFYGR